MQGGPVQFLPWWWFLIGEQINVLGDSKCRSHRCTERLLAIHMLRIRVYDVTVPVFSLSANIFGTLAHCDKWYHRDTFNSRWTAVLVLAVTQ